MKLFKVLGVLALITTVTFWDVYAAMPDMPFLMKDSNSSNQTSTENQRGASRSLLSIDVPSVAPERVTPVGLVAQFADYIQEINGRVMVDNDIFAPSAPEAGDIESLLAGSGLGELTANGELEVAEEGQSVFSKRRVTVVAAILLVAGLAVLLSSLLSSGGSGGGSGSGSGGGSGGEGGEGGGSGGAGGAGGVAGGAGGAAGGAGGSGGSGGSGGGATNPFGGNIPNNVPVNPEPSTFILAGLGLLLPLLRRKK